MLAKGEVACVDGVDVAVAVVFELAPDVKPDDAVETDETEEVDAVLACAAPVRPLPLLLVLLPAAAEVPLLAPPMPAVADVKFVETVVVAMPSFRRADGTSAGAGGIVMGNLKRDRTRCYRSHAPEEILMQALLHSAKNEISREIRRQSLAVAIFGAESIESARC